MLTICDSTQNCLGVGKGLNLIIDCLYALNLEPTNISGLSNETLGILVPSSRSYKNEGGQSLMSKKIPTRGLIDKT